MQNFKIGQLLGIDFSLTLAGTAGRAPFTRLNNTPFLHEPTRPAVSPTLARRIFYLRDAQ